MLLVFNTNNLTCFQGFTGYPAGYMNPADQRGRTPGGQYYAEYATINSQGGRSGPNRPPDIPQVNPAMQDYTDYQGTLTHLLLQTVHLYKASSNRGKGGRDNNPSTVQLTREMQIISWL